MFSRPLTYILSLDKISQVSVLFSPFELPRGMIDPDLPVVARQAPFIWVSLCPLKSGINICHGDASWRISATRAERKMMTTAVLQVQLHKDDDFLLTAPQELVD